MDMGTLLEAIEEAFVVERYIFGPDVPQYLQILVGACVALVVAQIIAVVALVPVATARDEVNRKPPDRELIQAGAGLCGN